MSIEFSYRRRKYIWTKNGKIFLVIFIGCLLLSYWVKQSLLFLLSSFFLSFLLVDFLLSFLLLRGLKIGLDGFVDGFAGTEGVARVTFKGKFHPKVQKLGDIWMDASFSGWNKDWTSEVSQTGELPLLRKRRGQLHLEKITLHSGFAFGFFQLDLPFTINRQVFIFPSPVSEFNSIQQMEGSGNQQSSLFDEFNLLEPYRPGDDVRRIHWKKSTLSDIPLVKKSRGEMKVELASLFIPDPTPFFEQALCRLTRLVLDHDTMEWSMLLQAGEIRSYDCVRGFLKDLAVVHPLNHKPQPDFHVNLTYASDLGQSSRPSS